MKLPTLLRPENVTSVGDTRERLLWDLSPLGMVIDTLDYGDYSVVGLTDVVRIERKSLCDLLMCCGRERKRFQREINGLIGFPSKALIIESSWSEIELGEWRSQISVSSVIGSLLGWQAQGLPIILAGDRERAQTLAARMLFLVARRQWEKCRTLAAGIREEKKADVA